MITLSLEDARHIQELMECCRHGSDHFGPNLARSYRSFVLNTALKPEVQAAFDRLAGKIREEEQRKDLPGRKPRPDKPEKPARQDTPMNEHPEKRETPETA